MKRRRTRHVSTVGERRRASGARNGERFAVGVDAGATWIRIMARPAGGRVRRVVLPAVARADLTRALRGACQRWRLPSSRIGAVVVASRGLWTASERRQVERDLRTLARRARVISDAEAAWYGALGGGAGVLILAGTGSIAVGRTARGVWRRAGGLGPLLGDEGSAFWIGREWLRARTGGVDLGPARALVHDRTPVARIAALAPQVLRLARRGNRTAARIVREGQRSLARLAARLAETLDLPVPVRVSWAGSVLARDAWFRAGLCRAVARAGVRARWISPAENPAAAALRLAESLLPGRHIARVPARSRDAGSRARAAGRGAASTTSRAARVGRLERRLRGEAQVDRAEPMNGRRVKRIARVPAPSRDAPRQARAWR